MTAPIVTPLLVRDAETFAADAVGMPGEFSRAGVIERVTALVMRVDQAGREQAWADRGGPDLLAALKSVEWSGEDHDRDDSWATCPQCLAPAEASAAEASGEEPRHHRADCSLAAAIAKAIGR